MTFAEPAEIDSPSLQSRIHPSGDLLVSKRVPQDNLCSYRNESSECRKRSKRMATGGPGLKEPRGG